MHGLKKKKEKVLIRARGWIIHGLKKILIPLILDP